MVSTPLNPADLNMIEGNYGSLPKLLLLLEMKVKELSKKWVQMYQI